MYHFEKKNSKNFSPQKGPRENVFFLGGGRKIVSPGPAVALDGSAGIGVDASFNMVGAYTHVRTYM